MQIQRSNYRPPKMPKRKRNYEPSLSEKLTQWHKELARGMKTAKGFERQRLSKRIREAQAQGAPDKAARLEREVAVLKVRVNTGNTGISHWERIVTNITFEIAESRPPTGRACPPMLVTPQNQGRGRVPTTTLRLSETGAEARRPIRGGEGGAA